MRQLSQKLPFTKDIVCLFAKKDQEGNVLRSLLDFFYMNVATGVSLLV